MTPEQARERVRYALPGIDLDGVSCWQAKPGVFRVEIVLSSGVTFAMLQALSSTFETDQINLEPHEPGHRYSSWTYDEGSPAKIVVDVPAPKGERTR